MKKSIRPAAFFVLVLLCLSLLGCGGAATPIKAIEKTAALRFYAVTVSFFATSKTGNSIPWQLSLQAEKAGAAGIFSGSLTAAKGSAAKVTSVYRNDEWYYINDGGLIYKAKDPALTLPYNYVDYLPLLLNTLPDATWERSDEDKSIYRTALTEAALAAAFPQVAAAGSFAGATVTAKVEKGYVNVYTLSLIPDAEAAKEGYTAFELAVAFNNPGGKVVATPPAGYQNYPEHGFS